MVVGVEELNHSSRRVYPLPADNQIFFYDTQSYKTVSVFDSTGKLVMMEQNITNELNVSKLTPGFYVMHVEESDGQEQRISVMVQ
jgi:hypothetical protein